ncbi:MAG TPA: Ig-like domain-containing protein [Streptosporangiaceae bacterium]|nr:Ig-like domain-containing protein [Streptosporangiaceae bacterium]
MIRNKFAVLACTVVSAGVALVAAVVPAEASSPPAGSAGPTGHWGKAHRVPGLGKLTTGNNSAVTTVSCRVRGDCAAGGFYSDNGDQAFLISEHAGTWGTAVPAPKPDPTATDSFINALSCSTHGNCVAVGSFDMPGSPGRGFVVTQQGGHWGEPMVVSGTQILSTVTTVSCARDNNCVVGGFIFDGPTNGASQPFVMEEVNGAWRSPQSPPGLDALKAVSGLVISVSCASPGNCAATGTFRTSQQGASETFLVDESGGNWGKAQVVPEFSMLKETSSFPSAISCAAPGECAVAGSYSDDPSDVHEQLFVASEVHGTWGSPQQLPGTGQLNKANTAQVDALTCAGAGTCVAVGFITDRRGFRHAIISDQKNGTWQPVLEPSELKPFSEGDSVSCVSAGNCVVAGYAHFGEATQAFTINEVNGTWGTGQLLPGITALNAGQLVQTAFAACAAPGKCFLGGDYVDAHGNVQAFLDEESPVTVTSLKLSAAKIRLGHEQTETLSVTVKPRTGGTPSGQVTISAGKARICVIKLKAGKGACNLGANQLKAGTYQVTGSYGGSGTYSRSGSPAKKLTVVK